MEETFRNSKLSRIQLYCFSDEYRTSTESTNGTGLKQVGIELLVGSRFGRKIDLFFRHHGDIAGANDGNVARSAVGLLEKARSEYLIPDAPSSIL